MLYSIPCRKTHSFISLVELLSLEQHCRSYNSWRNSQLRVNSISLFPPLAFILSNCFARWAHEGRSKTRKRIATRSFRSWQYGCSQLQGHGGKSSGKKCRRRTSFAMTRWRRDYSPGKVRGGGGGEEEINFVEISGRQSFPGLKWFI